MKSGMQFYVPQRIIPDQITGLYEPSVNDRFVGTLSILVDYEGLEPVAATALEWEPLTSKQVDLYVAFVDHVLLRGVRFESADLKSMTRTHVDVLRNAAQVWQKRTDMSDVWSHAIDITLRLLADELPDLVASLKKQVSASQG